MATRFVVAQTTPIVLAFIRYALATACLGLILGRRAWIPMPARDRWQLTALGLLFFGVFPWSFSVSLTYLPSTHVALVVATNPLVTLALSRLRGIERISRWQLIGQCLAFVGLLVALPSSNGIAPGVASEAWKGYLAVGTTVLSGSLYNVLSRPLLLRYDALAITVQSMAVGTLGLAPFALAQGLWLHTQQITAAGWGAILFLGIFGGAMGFGLWIWALRRSTPSRVAVFLALNPITAILLGVLFLGESFSARLLIGLAAVLSGIVLVTHTPPSRTA